MGSDTRLFLLVAVGVFVAFIIVKSRIPLFRDPSLVRARKRIGEAKARARRAKNDPKARAKAYREAAAIALDELQRPGLASSYARRADKADPESAEGVRLLARAMRSADRHRALEKLLWKRIDEATPGSPRSERLWEELLALYDGPLRRRAQARVLRALRGQSEAAGEEE